MNYNDLTQTTLQNLQVQHQALTDFKNELTLELSLKIKIACVIVNISVVLIFYPNFIL